MTGFRRPRHLAVGAALLVALVAQLAGPGAAIADEADVLKLGDDHTVKTGEVVVGDVTVLRGDLIIEPGATVDGNASVAFGDADVAGRVDGDLFVSGDLELRDSAEVTGDVTSMGASDIAPGAVVRGQTFSFRDGDVDLEAGGTDATAERGQISVLATVFSALALVVLSGLFAALSTVVAPDAVRRIRNAAADRPGGAFATGCLAWALLVPLVVVLFVSIVGIIGVPVLLAAYLIALALGWVGISELVGERLLRAGSRAARATLGALVLTLLAAAFVAAFQLGTVGGLGLFCMSLLVWLIVSSWPLGAGALTLFGTRSWSDTEEPPPLPSAPAPSPGSAVVLPGAPSDLPATELAGEDADSEAPEAAVGTAPPDDGDETEMPHIGPDDDLDLPAVHLDAPEAGAEPPPAEIVALVDQVAEAGEAADGEDAEGAEAEPTPGWGWVAPEAEPSVVDADDLADPRAPDAEDLAEAPGTEGPATTETGTEPGGDSGEVEDPAPVDETAQLADPGPDAETAQELESETEAEASIEPGVETEPAAEPGPEVESEPEAAIEPEPELGADLRRVPGLTPIYAQILVEAGIGSLAELAAAEPEEVAAVVSAAGITPVSIDSARHWVASAGALIGQA